MKIFKTIDSVIEKVSTFFLIVVICFIFIMSLSGIVLRWGQISFEWIDPLVRHLVFLSAFLAGILTTGKGKHLAIDIVSKSLETQPKAQRLIKRIVCIVSAAALVWFTKSGYDFFLSEKEFGQKGFLGIHSSWWTTAIPIGFAIMSYRFFYLFLNTFSKDDKKC